MEAGAQRQQVMNDGVQAVPGTGVHSHSDSEDAPLGSPGVKQVQVCC